MDQAESDQKSLAAVQALLLGQGPSVTADVPWVALIGQSVSIAAAHSGSMGADDSLETAWKAEKDKLKTILNGAPSSALGRVSLVEKLSDVIRRRLKQRLPSLLSGYADRTHCIMQLVSTECLWPPSLRMCFCSAKLPFNVLFFAQVRG